MRKVNFMMLLCVAGTLLASGCASIRVTTDLKPEADPALKSPAGQFYVASLKYAYIFRGITEVDTDYGRRLLSAVRKECVTSYPSLFAQDSAASISLGIEVHDAFTDHNGKMGAWMLCTACLVGTIFPVPFQRDHDVDVAVGLWNGRDGMGGGTIQKSFRREDHMWGSILSPLGLIPIPGESDFPKVSTAFDFNKCGYDDVPQIARQVATAIAKLIAAKDPAFWTAPAQRQGGTPDTPQALPTALPAPKESAAPL